MHSCNTELQTYIPIKKLMKKKNRDLKMIQEIHKTRKNRTGFNVREQEQLLTQSEDLDEEERKC